MESWMLMILVIMPGVRSGDWSVTFKDQCAFRGGSVVMRCRYDYPRNQRVTEVHWSKSVKWRLHRLSSLPSPPDFEYVGNLNHDCSLKINNVQPTDEGRYYFSFETTSNRWTSRTHAYLSVKELTAVLKPSTVKEGDDFSLTCWSECPTTIVWFKDGQQVPTPGFSAKREDAGSYFCAVPGQETVRSNSVTLNVQYALQRVTLSVSPPGDLVKGSSVTFNCSSDANPPVEPMGYSLYMDGQLISSGQEHTISDLQPRHSGLYHCQAWNNVSWRGDDMMNSTDFHLDVLYGPVNMSISVVDQQSAEGSSVNLTCSSEANPAADNYTWYKRTDSPSSWLRVGWGQVLSLPSVEASHTGLYLCQASNSVGTGNSTDMLLTLKIEERGSQMYLIIAGVGVIVLLTLVVAHLLYWKKQRTNAAEKRTAFWSKLSGEGLSSSSTEDQLDTVYANINTFSSSRPRNKHHKHYIPSFDEAELIYTTVAIKPRNNSRAPKETCATIGEREDSVIYSTVVTSS